MAMECRKRLTPGMNGTKRYQARFGDRLLFVRYRHDPQHNRRVTTVEIIVDEGPMPSPRTPAIKAMFPHPNEIVSVSIGYEETELRNLAKQAGAKWSPEGKVWRMPRKLARRLEILERIVDDVSNNGNK